MSKLVFSLLLIWATFTVHAQAHQDYLIKLSPEGKSKLERFSARLF